MAFRYTREMIAENWREWFRNRAEDAEYQRKILDEFTTLGEGGKWKPGDADVAAEMLDVSMETLRRHVEVAKSECPIGLKFKPSWEQAQILNAWHPSFEPEITGGEGYRSVCNFTTNRGGKTTADIIDTLLWLIPNDPDWLLFETFEDEEGKRHGNDRGPYRVLPRPDWETWRRTGRMVYPWLTAPPKGPCEIWHGVENDNHWNDKVGKEYLKWLPRSALGRRTDGGTAIFKQERRIDTKYGHSISGKTYNADVQDWAGKAVWRINMDEGFEKRIFDEAMLRVESGGYFHWAYTVAEPRNIGQRARLAFECYQGKHNLVGRTKFFTGFRMDYIPPWIMPADKKADDLARLSKEGDIGKVRMGENPFACSSPTVFSNFERDRNILPIDGSDVLLAMRGVVPVKWCEVFGQTRAERLQFAFWQANIIRGMDEGLANPTACTWTAILRTGEYVTFREWEASGLSVGERCREIVERSGNQLELMNPGAIEERRRYKERQPMLSPEVLGGMKIRRTFADSKMFKRNPESPQDDWTETYRKAGLALERATSIGPAARCDYANDMLRADPTRQHLLNIDQPGCRAYVTRDCPKLIERLENYLWAQIANGQRAGEFTDKPENKDDHTIDAFSYAQGSKVKWRDPEESMTGEAVRVDRSTGYISR